MRFLWSSDQHTLHPTTPTKHVLGNLDTFLLKEHDLNKTDIVFFGGDFFERMVERPNPDMYRVEEWATKFFRKADKAKTKVIFLAGTESHDRGQPAHLKFNAPEGLDFRYIDTLCIEIYPEHDNLSVMYVPDNMGKLTPAEIWEKALQVLVQSKLEKVDLIAFHGAFEFQLHTSARHKAHVLELWESIVNFYILAGHIHTPVSKGKLRTGGSFDRDKHGEEHPKGALVIDMNKSKNECEVVFWENKNALPYVTYHVAKGITVEALVADIHRYIKVSKFPIDSHIRLSGGEATIVNPVVSILNNDYPNYHIKADNELHKDVEVSEDLFDNDVYQGVTINKDNITPTLEPEVKEEVEKHGFTMAEFNALLEEFK